MLYRKSATRVLALLTLTGDDTIVTRRAYYQSGPLQEPIRGSAKTAVADSRMADAKAIYIPMMLLIGNNR